VILGRRGFLVSDISESRCESSVCPLPSPVPNSEGPGAPLIRVTKCLRDRGRLPKLQPMFSGGGRYPTSKPFSFHFITAYSGNSSIIFAPHIGASS
jgi:hypothetical protein